MKPTIIELIVALRASWSADTSYGGEWSPQNPARGHCVVSSLVVQDYLGGDLVRYAITGENITEKHYANLLAGGAVLDTTASQYTNMKVMLEVSPIDLGDFPAVRDKRLAEAETRARYEILKQRVAAQLESGN